MGVKPIPPPPIWIDLPGGTCKEQFCKNKLPKHYLLKWDGTCSIEIEAVREGFYSYDCQDWFNRIKTK